MTDAPKPPLGKGSGLHRCTWCGTRSVDPDALCEEKWDLIDCEFADGIPTSMTALAEIELSTAAIAANNERLTADVRTLAAYALNAAYGAELAPFELENLVAIAKKHGATVTDRHRAFALTRRVLGEIFTERRKQVEVFGYTPEADLNNPERLREEVLARVSGMPTPAARVQLVEAAAIVVAEIERVDRIKMKEPAPQ